MKHEKKAFWRMREMPNYLFGHGIRYLIRHTHINVLLTLSKAYVSNRAKLLPISPNPKRALNGETRY